MLNKNAIKIRSNELNIPFSNILSISVCQSLIEQLSTGNYKETLWLCNGEDFSMSKISEVSQRDIFYICCDNSIERLDKEYFEKLAEYLIGQAKEAGNLLEADIRNWGLKLSYNIDDMYIPVQLYISWPNDQKLVYEEASLRLILSNNKEIVYRAYPKEQLLSKHIFELVTKLELINNMSHYYEAYKILCTYSISGRKAKESLANICQKHGVKYTDNVIVNLKMYRDYSYMKKKWKSYKRQEKLSDIDWEDVMDCLISFIEPIWDALVKDEIFIDDWMPQIKRFLD